MNVIVLISILISLMYLLYLYLIVYAIFVIFVTFVRIFGIFICRVRVIGFFVRVGVRFIREFLCVFGECGVRGGVRVFFGGRVGWGWVIMWLRACVGFFFSLRLAKMVIISIFILNASLGSWNNLNFESEYSSY